MPRLTPRFRLGQLPPMRTFRSHAGRLAYLLSGEGPSIVLLNGAGVTLDGWRALYPEIEQLGTVLAYNRFGLQSSDPPRHPQTGEAVVGALRELLAEVRLPPPYLVVGHSLGGLFANLYARLHPQDVRALLWIEATHPRDQEVLRQHETRFARALSGVLNLPQRLFRTNLHSEVEHVDRTVRQLLAAGAFPPVPLTVVTGGRTPPGWMMSPAAIGARRAHQQDLARLSPHGRQLIAHGSGHFPQLSEPRLVLEALRELLARSGGNQPARPL